MGEKWLFKVHLKKQLYALEMDEDGDIKSHVNRFR